MSAQVSVSGAGRSGRCAEVPVSRSGWVVLLIVAGLTGAGLPAAWAAFPGANGKIVFASDRDGDMEIYAMNPDGSGLVQLTMNIAQDRSPAVSADGSKIAFSSDRDGNSEIYTMNLDGTALTRLTNHLGSDEGPGWSPDGTKIAFSSDRDGNFEIYTVNFDGTGLTRLTSNGVFDLGSDWSPDGTKIVFGRGENQASAMEIFVMKADGTGQTQLTSNAFQDVAANWSPNGAKIAFRRDGAGGWAEIYVMNADGSGQTNISNHPAFDSEAAWSPDGTKLVFNTNRDGNFEIYTMNADGSGQTRLTFDPGQDSDLDWQPLTLTVSIDIKPGSFPNSINPRSGGTIPVAILSSSTFDAPASVDKSSLTFGRTGNEQTLAFCNNSPEDVNGDGFPDQVCHFNTQPTGFQSGDTAGVLKGLTLQGTGFMGTDSVSIVP